MVRASQMVGVLYLFLFLSLSLFFSPPPPSLPLSPYIATRELCRCLKHVIDDGMFSERCRRDARRKGCATRVNIIYYVI